MLASLEPRLDAAIFTDTRLADSGSGSLRDAIATANGFAGAIEPLEARIAPATFIITSLADAGPGSLRDAILQANESEGADVILFEKGLTGIISVTTGQMQIEDTLSIKGPGTGKLTLDANRLSRIFSVSDGDAESDSPLTVSGLTFFRGFDPIADTSGGAIQSVESLKIRKCVFLQNEASESGGAIELTHGDGALLSVDIRDSSFVSNNCENAGGALALNVSKNLILKKNLFANNFSNNQSGAAHLSSSSDDPVLLENCRFVGNRADSVGGASIEGNTVIVRKCLFNANHSDFETGGLDVSSNGRIVIEGSAFTQNIAELEAGGLNAHVFGSLVIRSSSFVGNAAGDSSEAGGLQLEVGEEAVARIIGSNISGNSASVGAGILVDQSAGRFEIIGSRITDNHSEGDGAGIFVRGGSVAFALIASKVTGNVAEEVGGGLAVTGDDTSTLIVSSVIAKNVAALGAGISVDGPLTLNQSAVTGNIATVSIGGILFGEVPPVLKGSKVSGNISPDGLQTGQV